ncbi:LuxR C-terminal-related transcriptional regulator [Streptomyces sp. URMC 124]|uniref:helix-turn-helix transcriptional regulator n=1 Tax=Streptomyces sp. URMC 124 TaxID=3423405 RepID=UPI003F1DB549
MIHAVSEEPSAIDDDTVVLYRWAIRHHQITSGDLPEVCAATGLDTEALHRALAALTRACLVREVDQGGSVAWQAVSPQAASDRLLATRGAELRLREDDLHRRRTQLQREHEALGALVPVYLQSRQTAFPRATIDRLPDKGTVRTLLTEVIDSCTSEILVSKHGGSFPPNALREALPRDLALLARGIRMHCLYQHTTRYDQATRAHAAELIRAGAQIRTLPEVVPQMIVVDGRMAFIPAGKGGALVVREPDLIAYLLAVFHRDWANATPFATGPRAAHEVSGTLKQSILVLLAKGLKDDSVARRLGISLRTCRRHISELMDELGVQSRFEAGVVAERRGLTSHPHHDDAP